MATTSGFWCGFGDHCSDVLKGYKENGTPGMTLLMYSIYIIFPSILFQIILSWIFRFLPLKYTLNGVVQQRHADIDGNFTRSNYAYLALPLMFIFNVLPVLLLVLYPFKLFRTCLSKCRLDQLFVTTFVEKFHGCYRDGLDCDRDLKSFLASVSYWDGQLIKFTTILSVN